MRHSKITVWVYPIWDISDSIGGHLVRGPFYTAKEMRADRERIPRNEWLIGKPQRVDFPYPAPTGGAK